MWQKKLKEHTTCEECHNFKLVDLGDEVLILDEFPKVYVNEKIISILNISKLIF